MPGDTGLSPSKPSFCWALDMQRWLEAPCCPHPGSKKRGQGKDRDSPNPGSSGDTTRKPQGPCSDRWPFTYESSGTASRRGQAHGGPQSLASVVYS